MLGPPNLMTLPRSDRCQIRPFNSTSANDCSSIRRNLGDQVPIDGRRAAAEIALTLVVEVDVDAPVALAFFLDLADTNSTDLSRRFQMRATTGLQVDIFNFK